MINSTEELKDFIVKILEDKKAENILVMDLEAKTSLAKYMIFATGRSTKNTSAIAEYLSQEIKENTNFNTIIEGIGSGSWVALDIGDIIVHLFHEEARAHYKLEEFWMK